MMKTTQLLTNKKLWQNAIFAFVFLFSFSIFAQVDASSAVVGDELTYNGMCSLWMERNAGYKLCSHE